MKKYGLFLFAILFIHLITNIFWLKINNAPPSWDAANHTLISLRIADNIKAFNIQGILESSQYYPIFVHTLGALASLVVGPDIKILQGIGTVFFAVSIIFLYLFAKLMFGSRIGFFSASLFSFFPIIFAESRRFMLDLPLTAMFVVSLYFLEKSKNLTDRKFSIYFFIILGLLLMTKWTGLIFIALPLILSLIRALETNRLKLLLKNSIICLPIMALVALPWYLINFKNFYSLSQIFIGAYADQPGNLFSLDNLAYYLRLFINIQVTPILSLIFFASCFFIAKTKNRWILGLIGISYLLFTFLSNKDPRYLMPLLPLVAIIISLGLEKFDKKFRYSSFLVLTCFLAYFLVLSIRPAILEGAKLSIRLPVLSWVNIVDINDVLVKKYDKSNWNVEKVLADIKNLTQNEKSSTIIAIEHDYLNSSTLNLYLKQKNIKNIELITPDIPYLLEKYSSKSFPDEQAVIDYIKSADFLVISPLNLGAPYIRHKESLTQIQHYFIGDTLLPCSQFEAKVAPKNTICYVRMGEILETISDIRINDSPDDKVGLKTLSDFTKVKCPYSCSFRQIKAPKKRFNINLLKEYTFPDGLILHLYKL